MMKHIDFMAEYNSFHEKHLSDFEKDANIARDINTLVDKYLSQLSKRYIEIDKILKKDGLGQFFQEINYQVKLNKYISIEEAFDREVIKQEKLLSYEKIKMLAEWTALEDVLKIIEENKIQSDYVQNDKNFKSNLHWKGEKIELIQLAVALYNSHYLVGKSREELIKSLFQLFNIELSKSYHSDLTDKVFSKKRTNIFTDLEESWIEYVNERKENEV